MTNKTKLRIFATTAGLSAAAAPIVTLASCSKSTAPIVIDEKEKTKDLSEGERKAVYTFHLQSPISEGEDLQIAIDKIQSSQAGYTLKIDSVVFNVGSDKVEVHVSIVEDGVDAVLNDGTKFTFDVIATKLDKSGKQTFETRVSNLTLTYGVSHTTASLKLIGNKNSYTNPGSNKHTYVFDTSSTILDSNCTFECEVTKTTGTVSTKIVYLNTQYDEALKRLFVTFALDDETISEQTSVTFKFTIACISNGVEIWRQDFENFSLNYLDYHMWIFDEFQENVTYAGEKTFHLYVAKNEDIHLGGETDADVVCTSKTQGVTLTVDRAKVIEPPSLLYSYFDVPVTIAFDTEPSADTEIEFEVKLSGKIGGETFEIGPSELGTKKITFSIKKIDDFDNKNLLQLINKKAKYTTSWTDTTAKDKTESIECELVQITPSPSEMKLAATTKKSGDNVELDMNVTTKSTHQSANFNMVLTGYDASHEVIWMQKLDNYALTYVDPIVLPSTKGKTGQDSNVGNLECKVDAAATEVTFTYEVTEKTDDITDVLVNRIGNIIQVTFTLDGSKVHDYKTGAKFNLKFSGKFDGVDWTKTFKCEMDYLATIEVDEQFPKVQYSVTPGLGLAFYNFKNHSDAKTITAKVNQVGGTIGMTIDYTEVIPSNSTFLINAHGIPNPLEFVDDAWVSFTLTCQGLDSAGKVLWTKTLGTTADPYIFKYVSPINCRNKNVYTNPVDAKANLACKFDVKLQADEEYRFRVINLTGTSGVKATASTTPYKPEQGKETNIGINLSKSTPFNEGDFASFDLVAELYNNGKVRRSDTLKQCKVTYTGKNVVWDTNCWYTCRLEEGTTTKSAKENIIFNITKDVDTATQELEVAVEQTGGSWRENIEIHCDNTKPVPFEGKISVPMHLELSGTPSSPYFDIGDYVEYKITVTCKNKTGGAIVWTETVENCYLAMLTDFTVSPDKAQQTTTTESADFPISLSCRIPGYPAIELIPHCYDIRSDAGLSVVALAPMSTTGATEIPQRVSFSGGTPQVNDSVWFKIQYGIKVTIGATTHMIVVDVPAQLKLTKAA